MMLLRRNGCVALVMILLAPASSGDEKTRKGACLGVGSYIRGKRYVSNLTFDGLGGTPPWEAFSESSSLPLSPSEAVTIANREVARQYRAEPDAYVVEGISLIRLWDTDKWVFVVTFTSKKELGRTRGGTVSLEHKLQIVVLVSGDPIKAVPRGAAPSLPGRPDDFDENAPAKTAPPPRVRVVCRTFQEPLVYDVEFSDVSGTPSWDPFSSSLPNSLLNSPQAFQKARRALAAYAGTGKLQIKKIQLRRYPHSTNWFYLLTFEYTFEQRTSPLQVPILMNGQLVESRKPSPNGIDRGLDRGTLLRK